MRPLAIRLLAALAMGAASLAPALPTPAAAQSRPIFSQQKFAAISVDAATGQVLFAHEPDTIRHPASLAKLMTLYIVFDELSAGRMKPSDRVVISPRAAAQSPTKLGLAAGETISLREAIDAVAIRSANDIAVALAEHVSGTEARFATRMTRQGLGLGMRDTVFRNASGLPHPGQITTARDMAVLGRAILRDHPERYAVFGRTSFTHRGRTITGHNRVTQRYPGADGLKTGYIRASGFNLISSAVRDDRRVIAVVLGGPTGAARDAYMEELLSSSFTVLAGRARGQKLDVAQFVSLPRFTDGEPRSAQPTAQGSN
ncbi:MAG: D-alanyl-D-alanine carboxypeptidase family protein [Phenylobacterium sp.]|uniref:D-alanyl-D-alanine carboxypeptidase family protein n=1 Tax=Phenylobacterium sp. TaxID=1871053 RepID=UPI00391D9BE3